MYKLKRKWPIGIVIGLFIIGVLGIGVGLQKQPQEQSASPTNYMAYDKASVSQIASSVAMLKTSEDGVDKTYYYDALEDAFADAKTGDSIFILQNCTVTDTISVSGKSIILDAVQTPGQDHVITSSVAELKTGKYGTLFDIVAGGSLTVGSDIVLTGPKESAGGASGSLIGVVGGKTAEQKSHFILKDSAKIQNYYTSVSNYGAGLYVGNNSEALMQGGSFEGNKTVGSGGAVYVVSGGRFEMTGGTMSGNTAGYNGGAIAVAASGVAQVSKGTFTNNTAADGSALYAAENGNVVVAGTKTGDDETVLFDGNTATNGGTIHVQGTVNVSHAMLQNNTAKQGGGIYVAAKGTLQLRDATIKNNHTTTSGSFSGGAGVYDAGSVSLGGLLNITGNVNAHSADDDNNLFLNGATTTVGLLASNPLDENSSIGITTANGKTGDFLSGSFSAYSEEQKSALKLCFTPDSGKYGIGNTDTTLFVGYHIIFRDPSGEGVWADGKTTHEMVIPSGTALRKSELPSITRTGYFKEETSNSFGWYLMQGSNKVTINDTRTISGYSADGEVIIYPDWQLIVAVVTRNSVPIKTTSTLKDALSAANVDGDVITLYADTTVNAVYTLTNRITLRSETDKTHIISRTTTGTPPVMFKINVTTGTSASTGNLTLSNVKLNGNGANTSIIELNGGVLNIEDGTEIYGMNSVLNSSSAHAAINMTDGIINMSGGSIHDNLVSASGGGVYMQAGTFTMTDGEIYGNSASQGAGVYVGSGNFTMTGGTIHDNLDNSGVTTGAGIYTKVSINYGGTAEVSGNGTLGNNNIYLCAGTKLNIIGALNGTISGVAMADPTQAIFTNGLGENGNKENFTSDSLEYGVGVMNGEAYLGFEVTFNTRTGYFKEDKELGERPTSRTEVVVANGSIVPPSAFMDGKGLKNWTYTIGSVEKEFTADTVVTSKMTVYANWATANVSIADLYYYTIETAMKDAENGDTINILHDHQISKTVVIDKSVEITGEALTRAEDLIMFAIQKPEDATENIDVTFSNITLDGGGKSNSVMVVKEGANVQLSSNCTVTNVKKGTSPAAVEEGYGAVYVDGGYVQLRGGSITHNTYFGRGAGVHVASGVFELANGTMTENIAEYEGGAIYVEKDGLAIVSGGSISNNTAGNIGIYKFGSGIYVEGQLQVGKSGADNTLISVAENTSDDIYLTDGTVVEYIGSLASNSKVPITLQKPSQGVFTKHFQGNGVLPSDGENGNLICTNEGYTMAQDADGEVYIGYQVTYNANEGVFADDESGEERTRTLVLVENSNPELPEIHNGNLALDGWFDEEDQAFTEESKITKDIAVTAKWVGSVCRIGTTYYSSIELAVAAANKTTAADTIELLCSTALKETLVISSEMTIDGGSDQYKISRTEALMMIKVDNAGKLTLQNMVLNGTDRSYNLLFVNGGTATIGTNAVLTGAANAIKVETMLETSGPGTVYLGSGTLKMTAGSITKNTAARGAGVYVSSGTFSMSGGTITENKITDTGIIYGAGVYLGANVMEVSGAATITKNYTASGNEQNVFYTTDKGYIKIAGTLSEEASIGVSPSIGPTDITSLTMVDVTTSLGSYIDSFPEDAIYADEPSYEAIVDRDLSKVRLRKGHTVTFDATPGVITDVNKRVQTLKDGNTFDSLPRADYVKDGFKYFFEGWFYVENEVEHKLTVDTPIKKSMTVKAKFTEGQIATPVPVLAGTTTTTRGGAYCGEKIDIVLTCASEDAVIYYTLDGGKPTRESTRFDEASPISLYEDTTIRAIAVKNGNFTDSEEMVEAYRIRYVTKIVMNKKPATVFRGYEAEFGAKVTVGNDSTPPAVKWTLIGEEYDEDTVIDQYGVLSVAKTEEQAEITVRAVSEDPSFYVDVTVPIMNQYKVTYNKNEPSGYVATGVVADDNSPYLEDSVVTVKNNEYNINGYSFIGWNTKSDGSGTLYMPGDMFVINQDVELYAMWDLLIVVKKVSVSPPSTAVSQGNSYQFRATTSGTGNLTNKVIWSISGQEKSGTTISEEGALKVDIDETATQIKVRATSVDDETFFGESTVTITELKRFSVIYKEAGGSGSMEDQNGRYIAETNITIAENKFTRSGYEFVSWNTASNGKGVEMFPGDSYVVKADTYLYAQWARTGGAIEEDDTEVAETTTEEPSQTDKDAAEEVIKLIDAIPEEVTIECKPAIEEARAAYNKLTPEQQKLIDPTEYKKLLLREKSLDAILHPKKSTAEVITEAVIKGGTTLWPNVKVKEELPKPLKKNKTFNYGKLVYKVTVSSATAGEVTVLKPKLNTYTSVEIPSRVTYEHVTYNVTAISANAFAKNKKLKKVVIGKKIVSIGKKAFYRTDNLKKVYIKSKSIKKIGKQSFTEIGYHAYIKMPDAKYRKYEKLFKKANVDSDVRLKTY